VCVCVCVYVCRIIELTKSAQGDVFEETQILAKAGGLRSLLRGGKRRRKKEEKKKKKGKEKLF